MPFSFRHRSRSMAPEPEPLAGPGVPSSLHSDAALSDADLDTVVGGLARAWLPDLIDPTPQPPMAHTLPVADR